MAFSFRKIISNISYFSKSGEDGTGTRDAHVLEDVSAKSYFTSVPSSENIEFDCVEADSTSKYAGLKQASPKTHTADKGSLSDTDILATSLVKQKNCRKLKVDILKANQSVSDSIIYSENRDYSDNAENTPKHKLLDCRSAEMFRGINFNLSFDISDAESDALSTDEENIDIESMSDTDLSVTTHLDDKANVKMCRKVEDDLILSVSPESFGDVEVDRNEDQRIAMLFNYQMQFEKMECFLKKVLSEFQFHIEVSKIFKGKSVLAAFPSTDRINNKKSVVSDLQRGISPAWNVIEKEDSDTKNKLKTQLLSMRHTIDSFIGTYLHEPPKPRIINRKMNNKKKMKLYDFPDLRDAMISLFQDTDDTVHDNDCGCHCHSTDSGLITKSEKDSSNHSITSSIGNFSLDSTTLSAYSESLDQVISYCSFNDTSLYSTLLQQAAIERITFYIQVHSIQLKCEPTSEFESKKTITFHCPTCNTTECEENGLIKHILSPPHCEKIHFVYKTAYVKRCFVAGKEIQPSTVLNPMTMYRDENKIVCFGDAMYACSLCFENLIVGESMLMAHCSGEDHVDRRERLPEIFE